MIYTERIRALREDSDYNQTMVACAIHVAQTAYSDYEKGKVRIEKALRQGISSKPGSCIILLMK